jgi:hypothetical protein
VTGETTFGMFEIDPIVTVAELEEMILHENKSVLLPALLGN